MAGIVAEEKVVQEFAGAVIRRLQEFLPGAPGYELGCTCNPRRERDHWKPCGGYYLDLAIRIVQIEAEGLSEAEVAAGRDDAN